MTAATMLPPTDTGRCGQTRGYTAHRRRGEQPCRPCTDSVAAYKRSRPRPDRPKREPIRVRPVVLSPLLTPPPVEGLLSARDVPHEFTGPDVSQCGECWGWRDDPRHLVAPMPVVGR